MKTLLVLFIALCVTQTLGKISGFIATAPLEGLAQGVLEKTFNEKLLDFFPLEDLATEVLSAPFPTLSADQCVVNIMRFATDKIRDKVSQLSLQNIFDTFPILMLKKLAIDYAWYGLNDLRSLVEDGLAIYYFEALTEDEAWDGLPNDAIFLKRVKSEEDRNILKPLFQGRLISVVSGASAGSLIGYSLTGLSRWVGAGALIGVHVGQWAYEYFFQEGIEEAYQNLNEDFLRGAYTKKPTKNPPGEEKKWMQKTIQYQEEKIKRLEQELAKRSPK